jgi:hypothetical protein
MNLRVPLLDQGLKTSVQMPTPQLASHDLKAELPNRESQPTIPMANLKPYLGRNYPGTPAHDVLVATAPLPLTVSSAHQAFPTKGSPVHPRYRVRLGTPNVTAIPSHRLCRTLGSCSGLGERAHIICR